MLAYGFNEMTWDNIAAFEREHKIPEVSEELVKRVREIAK